MAARSRQFVTFCAAHTRSISAQSSPVATFKYDDLQIDLTKNPAPKPDPDNLIFGQNFSDHMLEIDWTAKKGWETPKITPVKNFSIHPAAKVFHYAIELFEGMKSFRGEDGKIRLFRPDLNIGRMVSSTKRSALPEFDGAEFIKCIKKLVSIDKEWVPSSERSSLYIRPTMIGTEASLGVLKTTSAKLYVLTGPAGPYYATGFKPISLLADPQYVRAWEGGCGAHKMGSNYAPTIQIQREALKKQNCQQVLWLYGEDHQITEAGMMNFFMFWKNEQGENELVTPSLSRGIILPGVTRRSLLDMAIQWGEFKVSERNITMKDIVKGLREKRVKELLGTGTACTVSAIERIIYNGEDLHIPTMDEGAPITNRFLKELTDIQLGRVKSDWMLEVD